MWPVPRPTRMAIDVFRQCLNRTRAPWRLWLEELTPSVADAASRFREAAQMTTLHTLDPLTLRPPPLPAEPETVHQQLIKVYTDRMVGQQAPGRLIYDELRLAAPRCPLCGHREVTTLDHHLPKTKFPLLSVVPDNLIPACAECNKIKIDSLPTAAERQTLHPYFDDLNDAQWLAAEVVEVTPPAIRFYVAPPARWSLLLTARARHHFDTFELGSLYAAQASDEISGIAYYLQIQFDAAGADAVWEYLQEMAASRAQDRLNSWSTAAYNAMAASPWYCGGGFKLN
jgi:hypothetical protein